MRSPGGGTPRRLVVLVDRAAVGPGELARRATTIVSSTVSRSRVELTARPTSPSAVSCSTERVSSAVRASQLLEQPDVLDGDDRLVGEGLEQRDLLGRERAGPRSPTDEMTPSGVPSRSSGVASIVRSVAPACLSGPRSSGTPPRLPRCPRRGSSAGRVTARPLTVPRLTGMVSPIARYPWRSDPCRATRRRCSPVQTEDRRIRRPAHPGGILGDGSMTGWRSVGELAITRRISPVAVCCSSASVSPVSAREQPHVLDGDHRLVGEGLEQRDLLVGEGPHLRPDDRDDPSGMPSRSSGTASIVRCP